MPRTLSWRQYPERVETLFLIGLLVFYVLRAIAGNKKRGPVPEAPREGPVGELDEALAEIREALGAGRPPAAPEPPARQPGAGQSRPQIVTRPSPPPASPKPVTAASDEFHRVLTGRPDADRVFDKQRTEWKAPARSSAEDRFESQRSEWKAPVRPRTEDLFERKKGEFVDPLVGHDHVGRGGPVRVSARSERPRLGTSDSLREAIILAEILGPPKALRGRRQR